MLKTKGMHNVAAVCFVVVVVKHNTSSAALFMANATEVLVTLLGPEFIAPNTNYPITSSWSFFSETTTVHELDMNAFNALSFGGNKNSLAHDDLSKPNGNHPMARSLVSLLVCFIVSLLD